MTDKHLDDAIDRAVREMMSVDADPAFRARVFARLERTSPSAFKWHRLAIAGATLAAVVLAFVWMRTPSPGPPAVDVAAARPQPAEAPAPVPAPAVQGPQVAIRDRVEAPAQGGRPRMRASSAANVTQSVRAGALVATVADSEPHAGTDSGPVEHVDLIRIAPLELPSITPAAIVIPPLPAIAELRIAPLSPQGPRD